MVILRVFLASGIQLQLCLTRSRVIGTRILPGIEEAAVNFVQMPIFSDFRFLISLKKSDSEPTT